MGKIIGVINRRSKKLEVKIIKEYKNQVTPQKHKDETEYRFVFNE
jgi:hypothetical protein